MGEHTGQTLQHLPETVRAAHMQSGLNQKLSFSPRNYAPESGAVKKASQLSQDLR